MPSAFAAQQINDDSLEVQKYVTGICCGPTTMAFMGNDILVLEKFSGEVHLIHNGVLQNEPVLKENVTTSGDQGMDGIDVVGKKVYLYFTESSRPNGPALCNCVYSYDWDGGKLANKTLVKAFPHFENYHIGGVMATSANGTVYIIIGDNGRTEENVAGIDENNATGGPPDDTGVIARIVPAGDYYAIGIRNSFGLAFDPLTGNLWDTENGPDYGDEVNMVPPNFNSGWGIVTGPANASQIAKIPHYKNYVYHDPKFTWEKPVAPTGISFVESDKLPSLRNSVLVGDCINGNLYRFNLNPNRDGFVFKSPQLQDGVANVGASMDEIIYGTGLGCITDIKVGPDGLVYVVSLSDGVIYRIAPKQVFGDAYLGDYQYILYIFPVAVVALFFVYYMRSKRLKQRSLG